MMKQFDTSIDQMRLDQEWLEQPKLYYEWALELATAKRKVDEAKQGLDAARACSLRDILSDPAKYDLSKTTDAVVQACVLEQPEYKEAQAELNEAKYHADVVQAAVTALEHRKRALENLVELHGRNYFSMPRPKGDGGTALEEAAKHDVRRAGQRKQTGKYEPVEELDPE